MLINNPFWNSVFQSLVASVIMLIIVSAGKKMKNRSHWRKIAMWSAQILCTAWTVFFTVSCWAPLVAGVRLTRSEAQFLFVLTMMFSFQVFLWVMLAILWIRDIRQKALCKECGKQKGDWYPRCEKGDVHFLRIQQLRKEYEEMKRQYADLLNSVQQNLLK